MSNNCCCPPVIFGPGEPGPPGEGACISTDAGNQLTEGSDGCLYVPPGGPADPPEEVCLAEGGGLSRDGDGCLQVDTGDGLEVGDNGLQLCLADEPNNQAQIVDGCLYVPPSGGESPPELEPLCIQPSSQTVLTVDDDGCLGLQLDPEGPLRPGDDGLTVCVSEQGDNQTRLDPQGCVYTPLPQIEMRTEMVVYEDDGTFDPADYPGLQYIRVRAVGGGGGSGGGVESDRGENITITQPGGAGSYAEDVFNADELPAGPIPVWVGKGGAGGEKTSPGGTPTPGGDGTWSSFGGSASLPDTSGLVIAVGGLGGGAEDGGWTGRVTNFGATSGRANPDHVPSPLRSKGKIVVPGGAGSPSFALGPEVLGAGATLAVGGAGGINPLSGANAGSMSLYDDSDPDRNGYAYGGSTMEGNVPYGGGGTSTVGAHPGSVGPQGNPGADGVVIVEVVTARLSVG